MSNDLFNSILDADQLTEVYRGMSNVYNKKNPNSVTMKVPQGRAALVAAIEEMAANINISNNATIEKTE